MIEYEIRYAKIKNVYLQIKEDKLIVKAPKNISKKEIERIIIEKNIWIEKNLKKEKQKEERKPLYTDKEFQKVVENNFKELIEKTKLIPNKIRIKEIKSAWGTCSKNKNITISRNLIKYSEDAIRYVIIHELCHIKEMNHSKNFWELVKLYMPKYKDIRKQLR